jgi:hypothetical protein
VQVPSLSSRQFIQSSSNNFVVEQRNAKGATITNFVQKPIAARPPFPYRYGDYPTTNIAFAEREADLLNFSNVVSQLASDGPANQRIDVLVADNGSNPKVLNVGTNASAVQTIRVLSTNHLVVTSFDRHLNASNAIAQTSTSMSAHPFLVTLQNTGAAVTLNGAGYKVKQFAVPYHNGGRNAKVDYRSLTNVGGLNLPVSIVVQNEATRATLRSARLTNFCFVESSHTNYSVEASHSADIECARKVLASEAKAPSLSPATSREIEGLRHVLLRVVNDGGADLDQRFAAANLLIAFNSLTDNSDELRQSFSRYISLFIENDLVLVGRSAGRAQIEQLIRTGKYRSANAALEEWVKFSAGSMNHKDFVEYGAELCRKHHFVICNAFLNERSNSADFATLALRCVTWSKLLALVSRRETLRTSYSKGQAEAAIAQGFTPKLLTNRVVEVLHQALRAWNVATSTPLDHSLKKEIDAISSQMRSIEPDLTNH